MAGCDLLEGKRDNRPPADPLAPLAAAAQDLGFRYEAAIAAHPELADRLDPVARAHRAHAAELARVAGVALPSAGAGPGATPTTPAGDAKAALADLRAGEQKSRAAATQACLSAPADRAALLGSIAAACATHLEVLR